MPEKLALMLTEEAIKYHEGLREKLREIIKNKEAANDPCFEAPVKQDSRQS